MESADDAAGNHRRPLPELKAALQATANARGTAYNSREAVIFYFENDNTGAKSDANSLVWCLEDVFGIHTTVIELKANDQMPGLTLASTVTDIVMKIKSPPKRLRSLLILAYAGHGELDPTTGFVKLIAGVGRQNIQWSYLHSSFFSDTNYMFSNIDTLGILDCCYAGATRDKGQRSSQVLSACGRDEKARSRSDGVRSFSQRLFRAARNLSKTETSYITIEMLVAEVNREKPDGAPEAKLTNHGGTSPISLPLKDTQTTPHQRPTPNTLGIDATTESILVELTIPGAHSQVLEEFKDVIAALPAQFQVEIVDAYQSRSVLLLLRMSEVTYWRLSAGVDFHLIGRISGPSLIKPLADIRPQRLGAKENVRPGPSKEGA
ncbi:hypothetical protein N7532_005845 [Penicillium argentinense]|uniref:Uncharacterized protein n=1 Tax=Penicillium argentinense TaxID=1131581 RepID=A0A9W9FES7_9EURO|nr:uncharacterized protein N7532_005845 [Penicillium argentinense]KAJ5098844.1 hypothetical protein N7532_005845 [Penicillium argentinense]